MHYYFRTMEDLYLAVFRRRAEQGLEAQAQALKSAAAAVGAVAIQLGSEDHGVHRRVHGVGQPPDELRAEFARYGEMFRQQRTSDVLTETLQRYGIDATEVPPVVWAVFATSLSRVLVMETALGMSTGHCRNAGVRRGLAAATRGGAGRRCGGRDDRAQLTASPGGGSSRALPWAPGRLDDHAVDREHAMEVRYRSRVGLNAGGDHRP